jgi:hypothetical protein
MREDHATCAVDLSVDPDAMEALRGKPRHPNLRPTLEDCDNRWLHAAAELRPPLGDRRRETLQQDGCALKRVPVLRGRRDVNRGSDSIDSELRERRESLSDPGAD